MSVVKTLSNIRTTLKNALIKRNCNICYTTPLFSGKCNENPIHFFNARHFLGHFFPLKSPKKYEKSAKKISEKSWKILEKNFKTRLWVNRVKPWNWLRINLEWCCVEWSGPAIRPGLDILTIDIIGLYCQPQSHSLSSWLWILDSGLGFWTWILDLELGLDLSLTIVEV